MKRQKEGVSIAIIALRMIKSQPVQECRREQGGSPSGFPWGSVQRRAGLTSKRLSPPQSDSLASLLTCASLTRTRRFPPTSLTGWKIRELGQPELPGIEVASFAGGRR